MPIFLWIIKIFPFYISSPLHLHHNNQHIRFIFHQSTQFCNCRRSYYSTNRLNIVNNNISLDSYVMQCCNYKYNCKWFSCCCQWFTLNIHFNCYNLCFLNLQFKYFCIVINILFHWMHLCLNQCHKFYLLSYAFVWQNLRK